MLIDTHCHLDASEFADDRDAVVLAASAAGVAAIVIPAVATASFAAVRDCCRRYPQCLPAYGIHPLFIDQASEADLPVLREWLRAEALTPTPPVAVGEIGLDFFVPGFDAARQEHFLVEQLKIARDFDLPVLLHVRRAVDPVLKCLRRVKVRGGIAHAFNGSRQQADEFVALGFKLGFGGAMTYAGSTRIRRLAANLPLDGLVLETDAPDIPPSWRAGGRNMPAELPAIAGVLADLRSLPLEQLVQATAVNAISVIPGLQSRVYPTV
jgi:TatD DNase family protein